MPGESHPPRLGRATPLAWGGAWQRGQEPRTPTQPLPAGRRCPAFSPEHRKKPKGQKLSAAPSPGASSVPETGGARTVRRVLLLLPGQARSARKDRPRRRAWEPVLSPGQGAGTALGCFRYSSCCFSPEEFSGYQQEEQQRKKGEGTGLQQESLTVLSTLLFHLVGPAGLRAGERAEP